MNHVDSDPSYNLRACGCRSNGQNLVVCIDGTSNEYGQQITHVLRLYGLVAKDRDPPQHAYYHSGIGTYKRSLRKSLAYYAQVFGRPIDLAVALNFESTILDAYRWLSETYKEGDCIFLFGFSRGAYQVRTLSAMIDKVGLIHQHNEWQIPLAYELYAKADNSPNAARNTDSFKKVFSRHDVHVHFVGAWDTVSSVGISRGTLLPHTIDGMTHVCYFRHALALDERRVKFLPEYAHGGAHPTVLTTDSLTFADTKEVWFAGTHSDVGGGAGGDSDEHGPALDWMLAEARAAGLRFGSSATFASRPDDYKGRDIKVNKSLDKWFWWLPEYLPLRRLTYEKDKKGKDTTYRPHRGKGRVILEGQKVHPSVWMSKDLGTAQYTPQARLRMPNDKWSDDDFWRKLRGGSYLQEDGSVNSWKEVYLDELMANLVKKYTSTESITPDETRRIMLRDCMYTYASSLEGWQALGRQVVGLIQQHRLLPANILCDILEVLDRSSDAQPEIITPVGKYGRVREAVLRHLAGVTDNRPQLAVARRCVVKLTDTVQVLKGHVGAITSVAFSLDASRVVSASGDTTIRIWDNTDQVWPAGARRELKLLEGHGGPVYSVAFSKDAKRIVSGSEDKTVRIWDVEKEQQLQSFEGHRRPVRSVAFSPDGKRVVSGSEDNTVKIWEVGKEQEWQSFDGHTRPVYSVSISPDGRRVVSGSEDRTIRIWGWGKDQGQLRIFEGHSRAVRSVAFSSDGKRVISGSEDKTVRIWDAIGTRRRELSHFKGHNGAVRSVAFSADAMRAISGSSDAEIRIWNAEPKAEVEKPAQVLAETQAEAALPETITQAETETPIAVQQVQLQTPLQTEPEAAPEMGEMVGIPLKGHKDWVNCVRFSQDGTRVVSGSEDKSVRIWDILYEPL